MERVKIGIIGCGRIFDLHASGYLSDDRAEIVAVCDSDVSKAAAKAKEWGAKEIFSDYKKLLESKYIDAVDIITPQRFHETLALDSLEAGKHVCVQKPMTYGLASADRMVAAAESHPKQVFKVAENYVFYPPLVKVKNIIDEGKIGTPSTMRIKFVSGAKGGWTVPDSAWEWRKREHIQGFGIQTFDHGHHMWSVAWYLLGEVERVLAWIDSVDGAIDCPAEILWKYLGAPRYGSCDYTHAMELDIPSDYYANDEWFEVTGSKGIAVVSRCTGKINSGAPVKVFADGGWTEYPDIDSDWAAGFKGSTRNFIDSILGLGPALLDARRGREILKMDLAVQESGRTRKEIELASFAGQAQENAGSPNWLDPRLLKSAEAARILGEK